MNIDKITGNEKAICYWKYHPNDDYYDTGCSESFIFLDGDLEENNFSYCPYCGCPIEETE